MDFDIPLTYFEKSFTGEVRRGYTIEIGGSEYRMPTFGSRSNYIYYETTRNRHVMSLGENYPLPIAFVKDSEYELKRILRSRSAEEAQFIGEELAARRIAEEIGDAEILNKRIEFAENERSVTVSVFLIVVERIDVVKEIDVTL